MYKAAIDVIQGRWETMACKPVPPSLTVVFSNWWDREERCVFTHPSLEVELQTQTSATGHSYLI